MTNPLDLLNNATEVAHAAEMAVAIAAAALIPNPIATTTSTDLIKPTKCAEKRVEKLEQDVYAFLNQVLQLYRPNEIMLAFNGGKDCTALLHMVAKYYAKSQCLSHIRIPVLFVEAENPFEEIDAVVDEYIRRYNINLIRRKGPIKTALSDVLSESPHIKAAFVGNRRTDPYCQDLSYMKATDPGWPPLMRICPMIDWSYHDVWYYIFVRKVPYCKLYENGYTSLGDKKNTRPNPHLRIFRPNTNEIVGYLHAAELKDGKYERAGRDMKTDTCIENNQSTCKENKE